MKLLVKYKDGSQSLVQIMRHKNSNTYSYINLTKNHICPCVFKSIDEALDDLNNYRDKIEYVSRVTEHVNI